jgi:predicted adenine nucleotide alpha hydrolase (AANH) superfamily ATPase
MIQNEGASFDNFEFFNFKKQNGFMETLILAKNYNLYRQNYCGCEFSKGHLIEK